MGGDALTPQQASIIAGVPAGQLIRWAWESVGPRNVGTRRRPRFEQGEIERWRELRAKMQSCVSVPTSG